ncbi:HEPN domain-containing protein [Dehalococcoidales bacterium]|nr:HEPN domain-containing protein [Dehalococcoidales bacterium]
MPRSDFKYRRCAEAISAAGQCIELSLKAAFLLLGEEYPKRHYFTDDEAENLLQKGPKELEYTMSSPDCLSFLNFGRISTPWLNMAMKISYWRREAV